VDAGGRRRRQRLPAGAFTGETIWQAIAEHGVTHFCGAPIVMNMVINTLEKSRARFDHTVNVMTAAAPPPAATLEGMQRQGFRVTHVYGLTETYGPAVVCAWHDEWDRLPIEEQATLKARQGVRYPNLEDLAVLDPMSLAPVPDDGETIGEVMFRGVMKGYLKDKRATEEALAGGWFHSGDLGVRHPDGYLQLRDRSKDIIISGGENISSIEVENVLHKHPAVLLAAVVARPDEKWGETPCAFIELKPGARADRTGDHRLLPRSPRPLQVPDHGDLLRGAEDLHRQGAEVQAAAHGARDRLRHEPATPRQQLPKSFHASAAEACWAGATREHRGVL
jgi:acyl-CoA synthetase (AMP-forming)/AMP-acid ligase II